MIELLPIPVLVGVALVIAFLAADVKVLNEYERAVVFRLGRLLPTKGPGLVFIIPVIDRIVRVAMRTITTDVPPQDVITKDIQNDLPGSGVTLSMDRNSVMECDLDARLEKLYGIALDTAGDAVFIINADEMVVFANAHAEKLFGFSRKEFLHQYLPELLIPKDALEMHLNLVSLAKTGKNTSRYRTCRLTKAGRLIDVEITMSPLFSNGEFQGLVKIIRDIRETMTLEKEIREAFHKMVNVVGRFHELRDLYTAKHQTRVSDLCRLIGQRIGFSEEELERLSIAAKLHDIGKVAIPLDLLIKPALLTTEEFALVKTHARRGSELLGQEGLDRLLCDSIEQHHEKMDGSGYPSGLKGENILLEARIICVADVVEAMSSHRPYRPALGIDAALEEILRNRGTLYDPSVVDACLDIHRENGWGAGRATEALHQPIS
ncbi:MAG: PAS/PAC sensor protein [Syntrophaceae bacterium]|nr:MAG: PAS/PAC sensor protein [Syntrophaceae bacterium]